MTEQIISELLFVAWLHPVNEIYVLKLGKILDTLAMGTCDDTVGAG